MTLAPPTTLDADVPPRPTLVTPPAPAHRYDRVFILVGWIFLIAAFSFYARQIVRIGVETRQGFWAYWRPNRFVGDVAHGYQQGNIAMERGKFLAAQQGRPWIDQPGPGLFQPPLDGREFIRRCNHRLAIFSQIVDGWVNTYDHLEQSVPSGEYDLDYPPLRLLAMTAWVWNVQAKYPGLSHYPNAPQRLTDPRTHRRLRATADVVAPLLSANMWADGVSALAMFALVWIWVQRGERRLAIAGPTSWRARFGDPMLLAPLVLMGIFWLLYPRLSWQLQPPRVDRPMLFDLDQHIASVGFWLWWVVRFLVVVCLARFLPPPFRAPACGLVAATLVWLNPALILDGFGWPQWDGWILPFFIVAAVLASVDWWLCAGVMLGIGCMFKGQILFLAPVLLLCPLLAGWPGRFMRIIAGMTAAGGVVLWPWLVNNHAARAAIVVTVIAAAVICILAIFRQRIFTLPPLVLRPMFAGDPRKFVWPPRAPQFRAVWPAMRQAPRLRLHVLWFVTGIILLIVAAFLIFWHLREGHGWLRAWALLMCLAVVSVPWLLPRRMWGAWLVLVFASALWLSAFVHDGKFSWFEVGFAYGARKFDQMQTSPNSLSNLPGILQDRFGWRLHDRVATVPLPRCWAVKLDPFYEQPDQLAATSLRPWQLAATDLDLREVLAFVYFAALLLCAVGAAIHMRNRSTHFLIALVAPSVLFVTLLTQMSVRYMILSAALSAAMVGVSAGMSLFQFLLSVLACVMLGTRLIHEAANVAPSIFEVGRTPLTISIFEPTHPDMGYAMLLICAVFLYRAIAPDWRAARVGDL